MYRTLYRMAGSTPIYGLAYPEPGDQISDAPATIQALAEAAEAAISTVVGGGPTAHYTHNQATPAATWTINHPLGHPAYAVLVIVGGVVVDADIDVPDSTTVVITFAAPTDGRAELL